jgi:hypothetical protein
MMFKSLVLAGAMALMAFPAQAQTCTRDNLKTFIADYFKAVETHTMSALPTAPNLRITENGVETKPGDGFVRTGGKATILRSLIDTERCGTVTQALVDETVNGVTEPTIVAVRLKVTAGRVSEIEALLGRKGASKMAGFDFYNPKALLATKDHDWEVPLPAGSRPTRDYMNEHANRYFSSFATNPQGPDANYATPCHRWEGGLQTTVKNPSCSPRGTGLVMTHTHRRFPVTDTETGATAGFILFGGGLPDVHMFKFDKDGRIYSIQAVFAGRVDPGTQIWPDEK